MKTLKYEGYEQTVEVEVPTLRDTHAVKMKLNLSIDKPRNGDFFTPAEEVHGRVELELGRNEKFSNIRLGFRGKRITLICRHACHSHG